MVCQSHGMPISSVSKQSVHVPSFVNVGLFEHGTPTPTFFILTISHPFPDVTDHFFTHPHFKTDSDTATSVHPPLLELPQVQLRGCEYTAVSRSVGLLETIRDSVPSSCRCRLPTDGRKRKGKRDGFQGSTTQPGWLHKGVCKCPILQITLRSF